MMFTGIITDIGEVIARETDSDLQLGIVFSARLDSLNIGASVCCSGCCLTVKECQEQSDGRLLVFFEVSAETLSKTTLGDWQLGCKINIERALRMGDELGGHIILGHIDGVGSVVAIDQKGDSRCFRIEVPQALMPFIAPKGSVALDGISLTVNECVGTSFTVNLISHTLAMTNLGWTQIGDRVNIEIDVLARYVHRFLEFQ